jgi:hypothetical protein
MEQGDELDNKKEKDWPKEKYKHHHHHNKNKKLNQLMNKVVPCLHLNACLKLMQGAQENHTRVWKK